MNDMKSFFILFIYSLILINPNCKTATISAKEFNIPVVIAEKGKDHLATNFKANIGSDFEWGIGSFGSHIGGINNRLLDVVTLTTGSANIKKITIKKIVIVNSAWIILPNFGGENNYFQVTGTIEE